jgi:REP element-mobilizing transposase RayT
MSALSPVRRSHAALRRGRASITHQVYLVTFTTFARLTLFKDPDCASAVARALIDRRLWVSSELLAWVVMPDHWHGLIRLGDLDYLPSLVQRIKSNTSRHARQANPALERTWATGYHDRAIRDERALIDAARYLVMNPVRAGLVERVGDYPFWDARWL